MNLRCAILLSTLAPASLASGQFSLEYTYFGGASGGGWNNEFYLVQLETMGDHYMYYHKRDKAVYIMDLYHQYELSISLAAVDQDTFPFGEDVLYVSQHLFDMDDEVELMFVESGAATTIVNEDGTVLQTWPNENPSVFINAPQDQLPIYNTALGTKLILSELLSGNAKVYSLPGTLHTGITGPNERSFVSAPVKVHPNPTASEVIVDIAWSMRFNNATIEFLDNGGALVLSATLTTTGQRIDIGGFAAGEYSYRVMVDGQQVNAGKLSKL